MLHLLLFFLASLVQAETGLQAWLRYAPLPRHIDHPALPSSIVVLNATHGGPIETAGKELQQGLSHIFGHHARICDDDSQPAVTIATVETYNAAYPDSPVEGDLIEDGFWLSIKDDEVKIVGHNERGTLYGTFEYLSMLAQGNFSNVEYLTNPAAPLRWTNEWDNSTHSSTFQIDTLTCGHALTVS